VLWLGQAQRLLPLLLSLVQHVGCLQCWIQLTSLESRLKH